MAGKLTARTVATAKAGRHGDGQGLYLIVAPSGARKWVFRFTFAGRVSETGLGGADVVSLAEARQLAFEARKLVASGVNPVAASRAIKGKPTFGDLAAAIIEGKTGQWRNAKHVAQWRMTLLGGGKAGTPDYCAAIRGRPVDEIDTQAVLAVLQPVWQSKPETATRIRGRIEAILDGARALGHIPANEPNPARWRGHLDKLLARPAKLTRGHHAAMPYNDAPAFIGALRQRSGFAAMALEFTILTAARTGESLGARWDEIDFTLKLWTIPASRMKANRPHRVPLSSRAMAIIELLAEVKSGLFVFPGAKPNQPLSGMAMQMVLRRMGIEGATVHGFRSAFRDWAGDATRFQRELAEAALAHAVGNAVEQSYRRGDALVKRRALMDAWASFCEPRVTGDNIIPLRKA